MLKENEIVLYQPNDAIRLEVRLEKETVWLNRNQMAVLFGRDVKTIGKHINSQYAPIPIHVLTRSHDRFLLIDDDVYHIGASIKDLGKRWFAIMKMQETKAVEIINRL